MWLVYFPAGIYFIYVCFKARSFFFFSAANPSIETGGMFFESKWKIFELIPKQYYPSTIYIDIADGMQLIIQKMTADEIVFPVIAKPDRGERGWCVKKINCIGELEAYKRDVAIPFLIQAYIAHPLEFSIFYYRNPNSDVERHRLTTRPACVIGSNFLTVACHRDRISAEFVELSQTSKAQNRLLGDRSRFE